MKKKGVNSAWMNLKAGKRIFTSAVTIVCCGTKLFAAREKKNFAGVTFWKGRISAPWMERKPEAWLWYWETTWKTQRGASLISCLHCRANIVVHKHWACPLLLRKTSSDLSLQHSRVCTDRKWRATPGDGGCSLRALAVWLHSPFKAFTSVSLAALLLIILLSSTSTHFSQDSTEIFFLPLQCQDGLLCFFFALNIPISETLHNHPLFQP